MSGSPGPRDEPTAPILPREQVAEHFALSPRVLVHYESRGLIHAVRRGAVEGYPPTEVRRLWTVLTLHRDLGVNLAGIEAILKLREHVDELHARVAELAEELRQALEADLDSDEDPR